MNIVAPHLDITSATLYTKSRSESVQLQGSSNASCRISLGPVPANSSVVISFSDPCDDESGGRVALRLKESRTLRARGWEALIVNSRQVGGHRYRAYRLLAHGCTTVLILRIPDTTNFMASVPNSTPLGDLTLPGTHESCALYGFPISQCQQPSTPIPQQLMDGVRYLDVRLRVVEGQLLMYHGPRSQRSSLPVLLTAISSFLHAHPLETLIVCLKEETPPVHPHFSAMVYAAFRPFLSDWFLENRIPTLGEVRGKAILLSRFERGDEEKIWMEGMGVHPYTWPDSRKEGFEWDCGGTTFRIQDWYRVTTFLQIPEKFEAVVNHLTPTRDPHPSHPFTLSYASASYFPLSPPTVIAKGFGWPTWGLGVYGVNSRLCGWVLRCIVDRKRVRGCVAMDFYRQCGDDKGLAELLVTMNLLEERGDESRYYGGRDSCNE